MGILESWQVAGGRWYPPPPVHLPRFVIFLFLSSRAPAAPVRVYSVLRTYPGTYVCTFVPVIPGNQGQEVPMYLSAQSAQ